MTPVKTSKSWIVTLGSFGMFFAAIFGESFGANVSPEGIAAAQNIAITSAGAGAAVSVAKRVPDMKSKIISAAREAVISTKSENDKVRQNDLRPYAKNTAWSASNNREELIYGSVLWVRASKPAESITAKVTRAADGKLVGIGQTSGSLDIRLSLALNGMPAARAEYNLTVIFQTGNSIEKYENDIFAIV